MRVVRRRQVGALLVLAALVGVFILLRLLVYRELGGELTWSWVEADRMRLRWTSVGVAAIVGASLAVSGVLLQALLRNPLASPFVLGISSGAALGVMVAIYLAYRFGGEQYQSGSHVVPALVGAIATSGLVFVLAQRRGWLDPLALVLVGVVISAICGALIMFVQHLVPQGLRGDLPTWMMGHINQGAGGGLLVMTGVLAVAGVVVGVGMGGAMDAATLGDDEARSIGLAVGGLRVVLFLLAGCLTSSAVALTGPIAFVGLIAPHAARLLVGPRHTVVVMGAALVGIALLIGSDVCSQIVSVEGGRMPVGIFTALIGGTAFIWLLRSGRGQV